MYAQPRAERYGGVCMTLRQESVGGRAGGSDHGLDTYEPNCGIVCTGIVEYCNLRDRWAPRDVGPPVDFTGRGPLLPARPSERRGT